MTINENQQQICARHGLAAQAPEAMVAVATASLDQSPIYGTRIALPENGTISWFIHCGEHSDAADFYQPLHTAHLRELLPQVLDYLALPSGAKFILDRDGYEDVWMEE
ncbi:immunity protein Imm33 domain-containing protein [Janthinobacterium sp. PSPC3-1]|uniref:immunity protein Imm33 domain-containing protein n=1 Tax=Janthinobacterium sp. PSPC3-1 TaxID=2804653 RepID=UPI003CF540FD